MTNFKKIMLFITVIILSISPVFSQDVMLENLKISTEKFSESIGKSLPFNSTMGLNWSDAYIGKLIPSSPPHFGLGASFGFTTTEFKEANELLKSLSTEKIPKKEYGDNKYLPLPGYTVETRLGGIILPFDIGFKIGALKNTPDIFGGASFHLIGGDIRYAFLEGAVLPLKLSIGIGFNYMRGEIEGKTGPELIYAFRGNDGIYTISVPEPQLNIEWDTKCLDFKAQTSIKLLVLTPYIGLGASHAWSSAGYTVSSNNDKKIIMRDDTGEKQKINTVFREYLNEKAGITEITEEGFESIHKINGWGLRLFGGISLHFGKSIIFDITGMYNFLDNNWGGTAGLRIQM